MDGQTDRPTDGGTNQQMGRPPYRYGGYEQGLILNHTLFLESQKAKASLKHHTWTERQMDGTTDQQMGGPTD